MRVRNFEFYILAIYTFVLLSRFASTQAKSEEATKSAYYQEDETEYLSYYAASEYYEDTESVKEEVYNEPQPDLPKGEFSTDVETANEESTTRVTESDLEKEQVELGQGGNKGGMIV